MQHQNVVITGGTDGIGKAAAIELGKLGPRLLLVSRNPIRQTFDRLDLLVHCAGNIFPRRRTLTDDGLELSFAIQYMARFVLTNELLKPLRAASAAHDRAAKRVLRSLGQTQQCPRVRGPCILQEDVGIRRKVGRHAVGLNGTLLRL